MVFDKFCNIEYSKFYYDEDKMYAVRVKNFFKQFTTHTLYSILLAIICVVLLGMSMFNHMDIQKEFATYGLSKYFVVGDLLETILLSLKIVWVIFVFLWRACIVYFLLDFVYITIYAITSMHDYMKSEYNNKNIINNHD